MRMRTLAAVLLAVTVLGLMSLVTPTPAQACTCATTSLEDQVERSEFVFLGTETSRKTHPDREQNPIAVTFAIDTVYKGHVLEEFTAYIAADGGACGIGPLAERRLVAVLTSPRAGGAAIGICGSIADPTLVAALFEGLPAPRSPGPTAFLVGQSLGGSRVAALDAEGSLVAYGFGEGRADAIVGCPEGLLAVEVVVTEVDGGGDVIAASLETRDLATLEVVERREIPLSPTPAQGTNLMRWVRDLECHDPTGSSVTYLLPWWSHDAVADADLFSQGARVHYWDGDEIAIIEASSARSAAADVEAGRLYAISGQDGRKFGVWDLASGETVLDTYLPGNNAGWELALAADGSHLALLARHEARAPQDWSVPQVDRLLMIDLSAAELGIHEIPAETFSVAIEPWLDGFAFTTADREFGVGTEFVGTAGDPVLINSTRNSAWPRTHALGADVALFLAEGGGLTIIPHDGEAFVAFGVIDGSAVATIYLSGVGFEPSVLPTTTTVARAAVEASPFASTPASTTTAEPSAVSQPTIVDTTPAAAPTVSAPSNSSGNGILRWISGAVAALFAVSVAIALTRRHRDRS